MNIFVLIQIDVLLHLSETEGYFKKFRNYCYKECPEIISEQREDNPNLCKAICTYDFPFELIESQLCVSSCSIMSRSKKLCVTNYFEGRTNLQLQQIIYDDISKHLISPSFKLFMKLLHQLINIKI